MLRRAAVMLAPQLLLAGALALPRVPARIAAALWLAGNAVVMIGLLRPRSRLFGPNLCQAGSQPRIALTFDDGPHAEDTPALLEILRGDRVHATFFFVGERARAHPDLVRRVAGEGHEVGAHSDTHPWWFSLAGPARLRREVRDSVRTLEDLAGRRPRFFRPPMGHKNLSLKGELAAARLEMVTWSARPYDTLRRTPEQIRDAAVARAAPGGILLLHEGVRRRPGQPSRTVAALPGILRGLRAKGLEPVRLQDLRISR